MRKCKKPFEMPVFSDLSIVREMARNNLILNPELWMSFIEARNHSSHSYDEEVATKVLLTNLKQMS